MYHNISVNLLYSLASRCTQAYVVVSMAAAASTTSPLTAK